MIILAGALMLGLLGILAFKMKSRGRSGGEVALIVALGIVCIVAAMFGILVWGFSGFG